jgi:hypothetical protein
MEPTWLQGVLRQAGFAGETLAGRYAISGSRPKRAVKRVLNLAIRVFGRRALPIAPFYVVYVARRT